MQEYGHYEWHAEQMIAEVHGETQWSQEIQKPDYAVAILMVMLSIDDKLEKIVSRLESRDTE